MGTTVALEPATPVPVAGPEQALVAPWVDGLPRLAAFGLVALGLVGTPLVLLGQFTPLPVAGLGLPALAALELVWRRTGRRSGEVTRRVLVASVLAVVVAALSTGLNARFESQHLLVDGDPAVYAVAGQLLAETGTLRLETQQDTVFGGVDSLNFAGAGFDSYEGDDVVRPSFLHLLPQVLAVASWVGGTQALLWANAVVSGFALLAVFAFGSRLTGRPEWALVAMTALAVSLPQLHFSRDTFSELPAQLLVFAGLALLFDAVRSRRAVPGLLAGLVLGASCLARIDAFAYLIPLAVVVTVLVLARRARLAAGLAVGVSVGAVLGYVVLRVASPTYLSLQADNLDLILLALAGVGLGCLVAMALRGRALALWDRVHGRALAAGVTGLVVLLSLYAGIVRPQVETGRNLSPSQPTSVGVLQELAGEPADPLRSYDELSLQWLTWYLGPVSVALGLLAFAVLVWRTLRRQDGPEQREHALLALAFVLLFGASTALYLWRPSIIPVHYWATRRFLPVTIPGLLLLAAWLVPQVRGRWRLPVGAAVGVALLAPPLVYAQGHWTEREYVPMLDVVERTCAALQPDDALLLLGGNALSTGLPQTLQGFCDVPVAVLGERSTTAEVRAATAAAAQQGKRLVVLSPVPDPALVDGPIPGDFELLLAQPVSVVALTLTQRPQEEYVFEVRIYLRRP